MNHPDVELLKVLVTFQDSKNLIEAAEKLKISQPAVTQRLQRLQEQVSQPLFSFKGRKKVLTHFGHALYEVAKKTFDDLDKGLESLNRRYAKPENLVLRVGGPKELVSIFSELIDFPGRIDHHKMTQEAALDALLAENIDLALGRAAESSSELISRKFFEGPSRILFHKKIFPSVSQYRDFQANPKLLIEAPCALHRQEAVAFDSLLKSLRIENTQLNKKATFEDWHSILYFVENGNGFAIVPGYIQSQQKDVQEVDIPHAIIPRSSSYVTFDRNLKKVESFKKVLNFVVQSS